MSAKKARQLRFSDEENSSSDDDEPLSSMQKSEKTPDHKGDGDANVNKRGSRSSDRIHRKRNREFRMPTREDVLKDIPDTDSPNKSLTHLKPRKLINDYTRVTNRYNQRGDNEWSSDSESNFIVNDDVEYETNTDSSWESDREERKKAAKKPKRGKVKRLRRISKPSSSDSESCEEKVRKNVDKKDTDNESQEAEQPKNNGMTSKNGQGKGDESTEGEEEEEEEETIAAKKKHNKTVIESDQESEEDDKSSTTQTANSEKNPTGANASDMNTIAATSAGAAGDQNEAITIESGSGESESGSGESESGSGESESDSGDDERGNSKRARLMKKRKDSWLKKFEQYKELKKAKTKKS